jgi:hypothetical protein
VTMTVTTRRLSPPPRRYSLVRFSILGKGLECRRCHKQGDTTTGGLCQWCWQEELALKQPYMHLFEPE